MRRKVGIFRDCKLSGNICFKMLKWEKRDRKGEYNCNNYIYLKSAFTKPAYFETIITTPCRTTIYFFS